MTGGPTPARRVALEVLRAVRAGDLADRALERLAKSLPPREHGWLQELLYGTFRLRGRLDHLLAPRVHGGLEGLRARRARRAAPGRLPAPGDGQRAALRGDLAVGRADPGGGRAPRGGAGERRAARPAARPRRARLPRRGARSAGLPGELGLAPALASGALARALGRGGDARAGRGRQPPAGALPPGARRAARGGPRSPGRRGHRGGAGGLRARLAAHPPARRRPRGAGRGARRGAGPRRRPGGALRGRARRRPRARPLRGPRRQGARPGRGRALRRRRRPLGAAPAAPAPEPRPAGLVGPGGRGGGRRARGALPRGRPGAPRCPLHRHRDAPSPPGRPLAHRRGGATRAGGAPGAAAGERGAARVRPGGWLVYSTCSLEAEENEAQVDGFLARHPEFVLAPEPGAVGADLTDERGFLRVLPQRQGVDGAFAARLRRRA